MWPAQSATANKARFKSGDGICIADALLEFFALKIRTADDPSHGDASCNFLQNNNKFQFLAKCRAHTRKITQV